MVEISFTITPGARRLVRHVSFAGNQRTRPGFLRKLIKIREGERFDGARIKQGVSRLYGTALFDRVTVEERPVEQSWVDLVFHLEERRARDVAFMVGYGSYELARGSVTYTDRNLFGSGLG